MSMALSVTVVPADRYISVNGHGLVFPFDAPASLHALQWRDGHGHQEWMDAPNTFLTASEYDAVVAPYVAAWEAERDRLRAETERPPTLDEAQAAKLAEIVAAYESALVATLTMPAAEPTAADVAAEAALFAVEDAAGLADVKTLLAARRDELRARVEAAASVEEVEAVVVTYPV